jgi:hypothetical protein
VEHWKGNKIDSVSRHVYWDQGKLFVNNIYKKPGLKNFVSPSLEGSCFSEFVTFFYVEKKSRNV